LRATTPALSAVMNRNWRYRLTLTFFGLTNEYIESVYEEIFSLKMHGSWSFIEAYNLPIKIRRWFIRRMIKYYKDKQEKDQNN
jgi:hypothetical protein